MKKSKEDVHVDMEYMPVDTKVIQHLLDAMDCLSEAIAKTDDGFTSDDCMNASRVISEAIIRELRIRQ